MSIVLPKAFILKLDFEHLKSPKFKIMHCSFRTPSKNPVFRIIQITTCEFSFLPSLRPLRTTLVHLVDECETRNWEKVLHDTAPNKHSWVIPEKLDEPKGLIRFIGELVINLGDPVTRFRPEVSVPFCFTPDGWRRLREWERCCTCVELLHLLLEFPFAGLCVLQQKQWYGYQVFEWFWCACVASVILPPNMKNGFLQWQHFMLQNAFYCV